MSPWSEDESTSPSTTKHDDDVSQAETVATAPLYDSDKDVSPSDFSHQVLDWQLTASKSFSDYTIKIKYMDGLLDEEVVDVYHVHRSSLVLGPRRCHKFQRHYYNRLKEASRSRTVYLELDERVAEVFPVFLDYVYGLDERFEEARTPSNAAALRHLAKEFGNDVLCREMKLYIQQSLSMDVPGCTFHTYYMDAHFFQDEDLLSLIESYVANQMMSNCFSTSSLSVVITHADAAFWIEVLGKASSATNHPWNSLGATASHVMALCSTDLSPKMIKRLSQVVLKSIEKSPVDAPVARSTKRHAHPVFTHDHI